MQRSKAKGGGVVGAVAGVDAWFLTDYEVGRVAGEDDVMHTFLVGRLRAAAAAAAASLRKTLCSSLFV